MRPWNCHTTAQPRLPLGRAPSMQPFSLPSAFGESYPPSNLVLGWGLAPKTQSKGVGRHSP